ncbi:MAG: hypothetical protein WC860_09670 [Candidatus Margulisiibacteriota bacterium]|jgi:hypothetical protein
MALKLYSFLVIFLIFIVSLSTASFAFNQLGYNGLDDDLLSLGFAVPDLALAEANIAVPKNPFAGLNNPAALKDLPRGSIHSLHGMMYEGVEIYGLNFAYPIFPELVANINWLQFQIAEIPIIPTENADLNTDIEATSFATYVSNCLNSALSYSLTKELSIGLALNLFFRDIQNLAVKGYGYSLTPGINYQVAPNLYLGAYLKNALSLSEWQTGYKETFARLFNLGLAYNIDNFSVFLELSKQLVTDTPYIFKYACEYKIFPFLTLRAGAYPNRFNAGLGLILGSFTIDYTYVGADKYSLANSSRLAVGFLF